MPDAEGLHRCPICFKGYKRREHLSRHRSSHTSERPHRCIVCNASFQRTDVLKRHLQTCDGASSIPSNRRRACDRCVRQKKACNSLQPCQNCEKRAVRCEYFIASSATAGAATPSSSSSAQLWDPLGKMGPDATVGAGLNPRLAYHDIDQDSIASSIPSSSQYYPVTDIQPAQDVWFDINYNHEAAFEQPPEDTDVPPVPEHRGYSFEFLYDFTSRTGLVSSFECATLERRQQIVAAFDHAYISSMEPFTPLQFDPTADNHDAITGQYVDIHGDMAEPIMAGMSWLNNPIVAKLQDIVLQIKQVVTFRPNNSVVDLTWTPEMEQKCIEFFSPYKFAKFMELYWSVWHPNVSIIHRPTFNQISSKTILLAAMALLGACVSPDAPDNMDARTWFNCVEEMVFTDADFCSDIESDEATPSTTVVPLSPKIQALQAAYVVCLYQNWEGADASKRRIRRHRFSTVVSVARDIGIGTARHLDYSREFEFHWGEYVIREELIRTFIWIFLLDTAFVIFNNLPHRMVIKEMRMDMASPEACFQAVSAEECFQQIRALMPPSSPFRGLLLRDAIESFCAETLSAETQRKFSQLGALNLFTIVSAFHYMIFQHQNSLGVAGQLVPIRNGLRNWISVWEQYFDTWSSSYPQDASLPLETMWKRMGFIRFAPEYWLLGVLLTNRLSGETTLSRDRTQDVDEAGRPSLPGPGTAGGSVQIKSGEPILEKYDQTSMRQVNDLITDYQRLHIE